LEAESTTPPPTLIAPPFIRKVKSSGGDAILGSKLILYMMKGVDICTVWHLKGLIFMT